MKRIAIYGAIISIIIFIFILIIGETFEFDFLTSALMIGIGVCFFFLFLTLMCVFWGMSVNNRTGKILLILLVCIFFIGVLIRLNDTHHIYKDKGSYEKEEFVIVEG